MSVVYETESESSHTNIYHLELRFPILCFRKGGKKAAEMWMLSKISFFFFSLPAERKIKINVQQTCKEVVIKHF